MAGKWNPGKSLERVARAVLRRGASQVRSSAPRAAHRAGTQPTGPLGGSLAQRILAKGMVRLERWGAVILWSTLGQPFMFFHQGSSRQKERPVQLAPEAGVVVRALEPDATRHYRARAEREP